MTKKKLAAAGIWDSFYKESETYVPYTDVCAFAVKRVLKSSITRPVIFEFGCGSGQNLYTLYRNFKTKAVLMGCDISFVAIEQCKKKMPQCKFWVNGENLHLADASVDIFIERGALHFLPKEIARAYLRQVYVGMKPGAAGFIEIPSTSHELANKGLDPYLGYREFYTESEITNLLSDFIIQKICLSERSVKYTREVGEKFRLYSQSSWQVEFSKK